MACSTCLAALDKLIRSLDESEITHANHHESFMGLAESSAQGCPFCLALWDQSPEQDRDVLLRGSDSVSSFTDDPHDNGRHSSDEAQQVLGATRSFAFTDGNREEGIVYFCLRYRDRVTAISRLQNKHVERDFRLVPCGPPSTEDCRQQVSFEPTWSPSTRSPQSWAIAEAWLSSCLQNHTECNTRQNTSWLPTRLIDVQHSQERDIVSLVRGTSILLPERYVTLSHRWGSSNPYCLSKATADDLTSGVDRAILPQAFQDAIEIARRLHVRYIWIDSLCIMQDHDDQSDWIREASMMEKVYSHSFLNISALASEDSSASFFARRDLRLMGRQFVRLPVKNLQLYPEGIDYEVIDLNWLEYNLSSAHLNLRAWVLQERLLAPRVLHFGRRQLIWECHEATLTETYPDRLPTDFMAREDCRFKSLNAAEQIKRKQLVYPGASEEINNYQIWHRIVEHYSRCGMTKSQDKLVAISGIVKRMSKILRDEYVCGMWRGCLASELLWLVKRTLQTEWDPGCRPSVYRAPSFSWASAEKPIEMAALDGDILIEVLDFRLDLVSEDVTGMVEGGWLLLKCQVREISYQCPSCVPGLEVISVNGVELMRADERGTDQMVSFFDEHPRYFDPTQAPDNALFCVPASWSRDGGRLTILLIRVVDAEIGTYCRFGVASTRDEEWKKAILARPDPPIEVPCVREEDGMHVIRLI